MTAAQILDKLLGDLGETLDLVTGEPGYEKDPLIEMIAETVSEAQRERDRARLIFGEAA